MHENVIRESIISKSSIRSYEFSLIVPEIIKYESLGLNFGLGITFDKFKGNRQGLSSGKTIDLYQENKIGIFYAVSISKDRLFNIPIKLELLFKQKGLMQEVYITDIEQPFKNATDIKELQLNFAFVF